MSPKYFTIVLRATDETAARQLVPGEKIGQNTIVGCSLGDALTLNDRLKELIPEEKQHAVNKLEHEGIAPFLP